MVKRLEELKIVDYSPQQEGKIYFGAWFELENDAGERVDTHALGRRRNLFVSDPFCVKGEVKVKGEKVSRPVIGCHFKKGKP